MVRAAVCIALCSLSFGASVQAHSNNFTQCVAYVPLGDLMDIPTGYRPSYVTFIETENIFVEGGEYFEELIIVIEPVPLPHKEIWDRKTILFNGKPMLQQVLENDIALAACATPSHTS